MDGCRRYLVCWNSCPEFDAAWITREDPQGLASDLLEYYESHQNPYLTGSSSSYLVRVDGDIIFLTRKS